MRVVIIVIMVGSCHGKDSILFFTILYRSINIMYILNYTILLCYSGEVNTCCGKCVLVYTCVCVCVKKLVVSLFSVLIRRIRMLL